MKEVQIIGKNYISNRLINCMEAEVKSKKKLNLPSMVVISHNLDQIKDL